LDCKWDWSAESAWWAPNKEGGEAGANGKENEGPPEAAAMAAAAIETVLNALTPDSAKALDANKEHWMASQAWSRRSNWLVIDSRPADPTPEGCFSPDALSGNWVDSQGNAVHVHSTDAYALRLVATLSRPPRPDIHLAVKPVVAGGGWQCGNSLLDPVWATEEQIHWVAMDGRVSVWVRPQVFDDDDPANASSETKLEGAAAKGEPKEASADAKTGGA